MTTLRDAKTLARWHGCHWFDASSMKFFNSRVLESTWTRYTDTEGEGVYRFISSEKFDAGYSRWYTVREWRRERVGLVDHVSVETVGEFQQYRTARTALAHIRDGEVAD